MKSITVAQLSERSDVPLIDVRERNEFAGGHVPGAVNIPMSEVEARISELPDEAFDVICLMGGRSARVVQALEGRGYDVTNVEGGTDAWINAGYSVEVPSE